MWNNLCTIIRKKDPLFRLQCTRDNIYSCAQHDYHFNTPAVWSVRNEKNSKGNEEWIIALVVWLVRICRHCSASSGREWTCLHLAVGSWDSTFLYSKFTSKVAKMFKLLVISALICVSIITAAEVNFQKILCYYLTSLYSVRTLYSIPNTDKIPPAKKNNWSFRCHMHDACGSIDHAL